MLGLRLGIQSFINISSGSADWILTTGFWDDSKTWEESATWID